MTLRRPTPMALLALVVLLCSSCDRGGDDDRDGGSDSGSAGTTTSAASASTGPAGDTGGPTTAGGGAPTTTGGPARDPGGASDVGGPADGGGEENGVIELTVAGGSVEGGVQTRTVEQGSQVTLRVTSDVADELHVHGYDLRLDLRPNQSADLTFLAKIPGTFEVELEKQGRKLLDLRVRP